MSTPDCLSSLTLVRHAETEWSLTGLHSGRSDVPLTDAGRTCASELGAELRGHSFGRVLTSPLSRARETARLAGFPHADDDPDLLEWDYGEIEGMTTPQIREQRGSDWLVWHDGAPGGESADDVAARVDRVIARVATGGVDALVFAHGDVLRVLAARWLEQPAVFGSRLILGTCSISVLGYERGIRSIVSWNDRAR